MGDCFTTVFCCVCSKTQIAREVREEEKSRLVELGGVLKVRFFRSVGEFGADGECRRSEAGRFGSTRRALGGVLGSEI